MAEAKYKISPDEEKQASSGGGDESGGFESDKEKIDSMLAATQKPANVLDPFSPRMQKWDKLMFSFLIFTAVITPFEVGFCTTKYDPMFVINRLVDLGFVCDIFVNFKLAYFDGTEDMWVYEAEKIRRHYLRGWFSIDLVSVLPFELVAMNLESAGFLANLKIFRVIRLLRLIKLLRILKSARILGRIQALLGWSYASFELLQYTVFVLMVIHWVACFWGLIGKPVEQCRQNDREDVPDDDGVVACYGGLRASFGVYQDTWLTTLMREKAGADDGETGADAYGRLDLFTTYLYALEFAMCIMVLSYATIEPVTTFERAVALFFMVLGGSIYAYMIGAICGLLSMADPATQEYQNMSDLLNEYIRENMIEGEHKRQLREFFTHCKEGIRLKYYGDLLELLSPAMQKELAMRTHAQRMASIEMFNAADATERARFLADLAVALESSVFPPQEVIFACGDVAEFMYFIHKGVVSCGSSCTVYKSGDHIGLDALLPDNRRETAARTLTFVVSYMLSQEHLYSVLENGDFPQTESKIRRYRAKLALKRKMKEIVALAKAAGLICPDGVRFSENERIFKDRGEVDQFKGTLKPSPSPEEFELKRAKVLDEIDRDKAEGEKLRKKLELEYLLGREVTVAVSIDENNPHVAKLKDTLKFEPDEDALEVVNRRISVLENAVDSMTKKLDAVLLASSR